MYSIRSTISCDSTTARSQPSPGISLVQPDPALRHCVCLTSRSTDHEIKLAHLRDPTGGLVVPVAKGQFVQSQRDGLLFASLKEHLSETLELFQRASYRRCHLGDVYLNDVGTVELTGVLDQQGNGRFDLLGRLAFFRSDRKVTPFYQSTRRNVMILARPSSPNSYRTH